jgi:hypothetical protein
VRDDLRIGVLRARHLALFLLNASLASVS